MAPSRVDVANPAAAYLLGPGWHRIEGNHRWMAQRATLRLHGVPKPGARLHLAGGAGTVATLVRVSINGEKLPDQRVKSGEGFDLTWAIPDRVAGEPAAEIEIETDRTIVPPEDGRPLGLVFGVIEIVE